MSVQTEKGTSNTKKEFAFTSSSVILQVSRGILVGIIVGAIVGSFRFLIEKGFHIIQHFYQQGHDSMIWIAFILLFYACVIWISAKLTLSEKDIKGSGIPQVEAELKGLMSLS